jgi:hypothetical protein
MRFNFRGWHDSRYYSQFRKYLHLIIGPYYLAYAHTRMNINTTLQTLIGMLRFSFASNVKITFDAVRLKN